MGDSNVISSCNEKLGGRVLREKREVVEFKNFLSLTGKIGPGFTRSSYTWSNSKPRRARVWERLDKALVTIDWIVDFTELKLTHLPRIGFVHCLLLFNLPKIDHIPHILDSKNFGGLPIISYATLYTKW